MKPFETVYVVYLAAMATAYPLFSEQNRDFVQANADMITIRAGVASACSMVSFPVMYQTVTG